MDNSNWTNGQPISTEDIYKALRRKILKMELEPGQLISENQMAQEYGVSRSIIRTVFTRLSQGRLLEIYPQRGTYVSLIDLVFIKDLLMIRTAIEKEIAYEIFTKLDSKNIALLVERLENHVNKQALCKDEENYFGCFRPLDSEFHKIIMSAVGRESILNIMIDDMYHISRWRNFNVQFDHRVPQLIEEHKAIVEGFKSGSLERTQASIAAHLETVSGMSDRAMAAYPNFFVKNN